MKTLIGCIAVIAIVASVVFLLIPYAFAYTGARIKGVGDSILKNASWDDKVRMANQEIQNCRENIQQHQQKNYKLHGLENRIANEVSEIKKQKKTEELILEKAKKILETHKPDENILISGETYTLDQLTQDLLIRVDRCKALDNSIREKTDFLEGLKGQLRESERQLIIATSKVNELIAKLKDLEIKKATKDVEAKVWEIVEALRDNPFGSRGKLPKIFEALEDDYQEVAARVAVLRGSAVATTQDIVDWKGEVGQRDALEAIKTYFSGPEAVVETPVNLPAPIPVDVNK